jgi:membrane-associated phospholipid phosphatase
MTRPSARFSRIALGAHYLSDVLGGIAEGTSWLLLCVMTVERARRGRLPVEPPLKRPEERVVLSRP